MVLLRRIVLAQLEGSGRGSLASYNPRSYEDLITFIEQNPLMDGDEWLKLLLRKNEMLGTLGALLLLLPSRLRASASAEVCSMHDCILTPLCFFCCTAVRIMEVRKAYCEEVRNH